MILSLQLQAAEPVDRPVSFVNDVIPVMTKAGCNIGACHAKANGGKNGFSAVTAGV